MTLSDTLATVHFPTGDRPAVGDAPVRASWAGDRHTQKERLVPMRPDCPYCRDIRTWRDGHPGLVRRYIAQPGKVRPLGAAHRRQHRMRPL